MHTRLPLGGRRTTDERPAQTKSIAQLQQGQLAGQMVIFEEEMDELLTAGDGEWEDVAVEIILDSGACRHVMAR